MTTTPAGEKPTLVWLVQSPGGRSFNAGLVAACYGQEGPAIVLNHLLYEGACKAHNTNFNIAEHDAIEIRTDLESIQKGLAEKLGRRFSIGTIITYISKLKSWGFIQSPKYKKIYEIFYRTIQEALNTPPAPEPAKPRGIRTKAGDSKIRKEIKIETPAVPEDFNFDEVSNLKSLVSNLISRVSNLISRVSNLESEKNAEAARNADLEAKIQDLYNITYNITNKEEKNKDVKRDTAPTRSRRTQSTDVVKLGIHQPTLPDKPEIDLSHFTEEEKKIYDILPRKHQNWFVKLNEYGRAGYVSWTQKSQEPIYPALGENTVEALNSLTRKYSVEDIKNIHKNAYANKEDREWLSTHGGFQIHLLPHFANKWLTQREDEALQKSLAEQDNATSITMITPLEDEGRLVPWTKAGDYFGDPVENWQQFELMPIRDARIYSWHEGLMPRDVQNRILIRLKQAEKQQQQQYAIAM